MGGRRGRPTRLRHQRASIADRAKLDAPPGAVDGALKLLAGSFGSAEEAADLAADLVILADLIVTLEGRSLDDAVRRRFNAVSAEIGAGERL